ncbi:hypothetical protein GCM10011348_16010 [Marinobacterium nitratireducens]|uniref:Excisionase n=1 Tax=Marinobacterium nitratireducens TaxID=518897 RepID=A0A917ZBR7_9GAMM|nr:excisionase family protein [Marinobacterium nitratireducens]GGO80091.1 hypothetical protein GCM10011348_16010 [Marinobacterium nitratireducens]
MTQKIVTLPGRWIRSNLTTATWGISADCARKYRERGIWLEGKHWKYDPIGKVVYNREEVDNWFEEPRVA